MRVGALLLVIAAAACGRPTKGDTQAPQLHLVLKPWSDISQDTFPTSTVSVKVVALRSAGADINDSSDLVPAVGEAIAWRFVGNVPPDAALSTAASGTDALGLAEVAASVGTRANIALQVEAAAAGADPVTFTINIRPDARRLELLVPTTITSTVDRSETIRVRLLRDMVGGAPLPGQTLRFTLNGGLRNNAEFAPTPGPSITAVTDQGGVATARFYTGTVTNTVGYQLEVGDAAGCVTVPCALITVSVGPRGTGGDGCRYFTDCDSGFVCDAGQCRPAGSYCAEDADCPTGYTCNSTSRQCEIPPADPCNDGCQPGNVCGSAGCCIPTDGCLSPADCPTGWTCDTCAGACLPPNSTPALDVRGSWNTTYHFDISDTLPSFFTDGLGPVVDFLSLLFAGQLNIDVPILGDILEALLADLVNQYVPDWVRTVVEVLADFIHLFENMEARGDMFLTQTPLGPPLGTQVAGEESWNSAQFYVMSLCPGGPAQFLQDPSCGRIDVVLVSNLAVPYSNDSLVVDVNVDPFIGEVMADVLRLNGRNVTIELAQLINVLLDVVVFAASDGAYADFETFLYEIVPCEDFQYAVDDLFCDLTGGDICSVPGVQLLCETAMLAAIDGLENALADVSIEFLDLDFDARARIHDVPLGGAADILGDPLDPDNDAESGMTGTTSTVLFSGDLDATSWWYATRP